MSIPAAQGRLAEDLGGQNLSEGHHHMQIGSQGCQGLLGLVIVANALGGEHGQPELQTPLLHR